MKRRFRIPDLLLGILLTVAVFAMGAVFSSQYYPRNAENQRSEQTASQKSENIASAESADERIAHYTLWLTIFTGVLAVVSIVQGLLLMRADKTARIAANAADLNARAAVAVNLPLIRVRPAKEGYGSSRDGDAVEHRLMVGSLVFSNHGATKAFPIEVKYGWFVGDELPKEPVYFQTKTFNVGLVFETPPPITSQTPHVTPEMFLPDASIQIPEDGYDRIRDRTLHLWFYCLLTYLDFMDTRHEVGFCWRRYESFGKGGFSADPAPAYNRKT